jgi:hypothetical protein
MDLKQYSPFRGGKGGFRLSQQRHPSCLTAFASHPCVDSRRCHFDSGLSHASFYQTTKIMSCLVSSYRDQRTARLRSLWRASISIASSYPRIHVLLHARTLENSFSIPPTRYRCVVMQTYTLRCLASLAKSRGANSLNSGG